MYVLMRWENFCCGCFNCNLEAVEAAGFRCPDFGGVKLLLKFSLKILLEAAKNARMWEMQWRSVLRDGQSLLPSRTKVCFFVHLTNVSVVYGESTKQCGFSCRLLCFWWFCVLTIALSGGKLSWSSLLYGLCWCRIRPNCRHCCG